MAKTIKIDEIKCVGCGICANTCKEGAIGMVDGKAKLLRADHCDGLGRCLPVCPADAISFVDNDKSVVKAPAAFESLQETKSHQWPLKIKLVVPNAPFFEGADLLVAADCSAFANVDFQNDWMKGKITLIGCPKLDGGDYTKKLSDILKQNDIKSVTAVRMEVPCCGGIENSVKAALDDCGKLISSKVITLSTNGTVENVV